MVSSAALNVRSSASITAAKNGTEAVGSSGTVTGGPTTANGYTWWQVNWSNGISGWSIANYLAPSLTTTVGMGTSLPLADLKMKLQEIETKLLSLCNFPPPPADVAEQSFADLLQSFKGILEEMR